MHSACSTVSAVIIANIQEQLLERDFELRRHDQAMDRAAGHAHCRPSTPKHEDEDEP